MRRKTCAPGSFNRTPFLAVLTSKCTQFGLSLVDNVQFSKAMYTGYMGCISPDNVETYCFGRTFCF